MQVCQALFKIIKRHFQWQINHFSMKILKGGSSAEKSDASSLQQKSKHQTLLQLPNFPRLRK
jgi:hypothetical protein